METAILDKRIDYDGSQLHSHFAIYEAGILGDSMVAFFGGANVTDNFLVDLIDKTANHTIVAKEMLHFIVEHFPADLTLAVFRQRLLVAIARETLVQHCDCPVERRGDDLFVENRKLTVSIATISTVSTLIHFAANIDPEGAPIPAIGLAEMGVDAREFAEDLMRRVDQELDSIAHSMVKVKAVP
jgi:hypothetical protein